MVYYRSDREYRDLMDDYDEQRKADMAKLQKMGAVTQRIKVPRDNDFEYGSQAWFWQEQLIKTVEKYNTARSDNTRDKVYTALERMEKNIHLKHSQNNDPRNEGISDAEDLKLQVAIRKAQRQMRKYW